MLALFYIFIGVAIGVSFWQITRILNLRGVIATDKDNDRQGKYFILFGIFIYALMIYCLIGMNVLMLPESASYEGENDDLLFDISFWMIGIVQFIMQFIIFFFTYKYRGKKNKEGKVLCRQSYIRNDLDCYSRGCNYCTYWVWYFPMDRSHEY